MSTSLASLKTIVTSSRLSKRRRIFPPLSHQAYSFAWRVAVNATYAASPLDLTNASSMTAVHRINVSLPATSKIFIQTRNLAAFSRFYSFSSITMTLTRSFSVWGWPQRSPHVSRSILAFITTRLIELPTSQMRRWSSCMRKTLRPLWEAWMSKQMHKVDSSH